ncbi:MAG: aspartate carbamoyltransferase [Oscillospiraceae bacterium]|jgi:aspartate carbamoyltransferase catalytic subunit|nr:aspartate carbamoyltransferase [Oscillospiraceae bacterium]
MRHLIDFTDLSEQEWQRLYRRFEEIAERPGDYRDALRGQTLASLFYEPSTRTRLSFEAAMLKLGGGVFGFSDPAASSVSKGETLKDTIIMISGYANVVTLRHPKEGAAMAAALYSSAPVVNAGDGGHNHPTQTLTDLVTIRRLRGSVGNLRIGVCGDLKYGRTVHSLLRALARFEGVSAVLVSAPELALPGYVKRSCKNLNLTEEPDLRAAAGGVDILYMTRVQRERFTDAAEYERLKLRYTLTPEILREAPKDLLILHPLPRAGEIPEAVDNDPRAAYFDQARYGLTARMALLLELCSLPPFTVKEPEPGGGTACGNPRCITQTEPYLPASGGGVCRYCEHPLVTPPGV